MEQSNEALKAFNNIAEMIREIRILIKSKKGGWRVRDSNKTEQIERRFKEALEGTKNQIESNIWYGKGYAIAGQSGLKVDVEFHHLMGLLIMKFNDISIRLDAEKLDDKLVEHLESQLGILSEYAQRFWNLQGIINYQNKEADAMKTIDDFRSRLWDFVKSMEPYLRKTETEKAADEYVKTHS
ncbi:MAG: hypothetical protein ABSA75_04265 [Candidatus Bathyarchaeia archaeon]